MPTPLEITAMMAATAAARNAANAQAEAQANANAQAAKAIEHLRDYAVAAEKAADRNRKLAITLRDGSFARHAAQMAQINREHEKLRRVAAVQQLVAERGRAGAAVEMARPHLGTLGRTAAVGYGVAAATVGSMARSGFGGTVEGYRLEIAWQRLSRQIAAVFVPVMDRVSRVVEKTTLWFQRLNGSQQDAIMAVGLATAGVVAFGAAVKVAAVTLGALSGVVRAVGMVAGAAGLSTAAGAAGSAMGAGAGAAGGTAATAGAGAGLFAPFAIGAAGLNALLQQRKVLEKPFSGRAMAESYVPGFGLISDIHRRVTGAPSRPGSATELSPKGSRSDKFDRVLGALVPGFGLFNAARQNIFGKEATEADKAKAEEKRRRDMTLNQTGFSELGSNYFSISEEMLKDSAARLRGEKDQTDLLVEIRDQIRNLGRLVGL